MTKEQAKKILEVKEAIARMISSPEYLNAYNHFNDMCRIMEEWVESGAYFPEIPFTDDESQFDFDSNPETYGRVDFMNRTIKIKIKDQDYLVALDQARAMGLAREIS